MTWRRRGREGKGQRRRRRRGERKVRAARSGSGSRSLVRHCGEAEPRARGGSGAASCRPAPSSGNPIGGGSGSGGSSEPRRQRRQSGGGGGEEAAELSERPRRAESFEAQAERSEGIAAPRKECQPPASTRYRPRSGGDGHPLSPLPNPVVTRGGGGRRQGGHLHLPSPPGRRGSRPPPSLLPSLPASLPAAMESGCPLPPGWRASLAARPPLFITAEPRRGRSASPRSRPQRPPLPLSPERRRPGPRPRPPLCVRFSGAGPSRPGPRLPVLRPGSPVGPGSPRRRPLLARPKLRQAPRYRILSRPAFRCRRSPFSLRASDFFFSLGLRFFQ